MAGVRNGVFKSFVLGDTIREPETITVEGEAPQVIAGLHGNKATFADLGSGSYYRVEIKAHLIRGDTETYEAFLRRRLNQLINFQKSRGVHPAGGLSTAGTLAIAEDSTKAWVSVNVESPGAPVNIEVTPATTSVFDDERWFIFDPSTGIHETFKSDASPSTMVIADTLVNTYQPGSILFRATFCLTNAFLLPGIRISGEDAGSHMKAADIPLEFWSADDPLFDSGV